MLTDQDIKAVTNALAGFLEVREGARRFHATRIGKGVNPAYCLCDFLDLVRKDDRKSLERVYGPEVLSKASLSETSGISGGYLVPVALREQLFETLDEESIIRPRATVVDMPTLTVRLPLPDAVTVNGAGISPFMGGLSLAWTEDNTAFTESEPQWREVELTAWNLAGLCYASNPLLADATRGFEPFLRRLFARGVAWSEDYAFLQGDGVGKPKGTMKSACALARNRAGAGHFAFADSQAMVAMLLPGSWTRAIWVMHPLALADLVALATTTTALMQANQPRTDTAGPVASLHNLPVFTTERVPTLGSPGDVQLIDPALYVIGDRNEIEIAVSADEPTAFLKNQSVFRILSRVDGQAWLGGAVTLADGTTQTSSFVYLN